MSKGRIPGKAFESFASAAASRARSQSRNRRANEEIPVAGSNLLWTTKEGVEVRFQSTVGGTKRPSSLAQQVKEMKERINEEVEKEVADVEKHYPGDTMDTILFSAGLSHNFEDKTKHLTGECKLKSTGQSAGSIHVCETLEEQAISDRTKPKRSLSKSRSRSRSKSRAGSPRKRWD
ncbi:hypothetical protein BC567DRAFT_211885 [Phyllosticta citribraziliensis]